MKYRTFIQTNVDNKFVLMKFFYHYFSEDYIKSTINVDKIDK